MKGGESVITITKKAIDKLKEDITKSENAEKIMLRIGFAGYGWGGPRFSLTLDELKKDNDIVEEREGIKIVFEENLRQFLNDTTIDYSNNWFTKGFSIRGGGASKC